MQVELVKTLPKLSRKKNVCAYARVSIDKDAMHHSLAAQVSYYSSYIQSRSEWNYVGVFSDDAITGTKEKRPGFQAMLDKAMNGEIDIIITKSVSRFARNTVILLKTMRELRNRNVDIYFEEQNIHTLSATGELLISLFASLAQEESRSVSENLKWRIKRDFEEGKYWGGGDCYGYKIENRQFVLVHEEAELVKRIFDMYLSGKSMQMICNILNDEGIKTMNSSKWAKSTIQTVLTNYNYTGDLILQKTYKDNYLTKVNKRNKGEFNMYLVSNHHEAIISKEDFELAQQRRLEMSKKYNAKDVSNIRYPYSGLLKCSCCGATYRHKTTKYSKFWVCDSFNKNGKKACPDSKAVPDDELDRLTSTVIKDINEAKEFIDFIDVNSGNELVYHLKNGEVIVVNWNDHSRKNSWTPEMKEKARQKTLERNRQKHGNSNSNTSENKC